MQKSPIIIGIDPGTTLGIAIVGIDGKLTNYYSQRAYGLSDAISHVTKQGYPICIGTDKAKIPKLIKNISTNLGIKIYSPKEDMTSEEKRILIQKYETKFRNTVKYNNAHEYDSICCALYAYSKAKKLLSKIKQKISLVKEDNRIDFYKRAFSEDIPIHRLLDETNKKIEESEIRNKKDIQKNNNILKNEKLPVTNHARNVLQTNKEKESSKINKQLEQKINEQEQTIKNNENKIKMLRNRIKMLESKDRKNLKKENKKTNREYAKLMNSSENETTLKEIVYNDYEIIKINDNYYIKNNSINNHELTNLRTLYTSKGKKITLYNKPNSQDSKKSKKGNIETLDVEQLLEQHKLLRRIAKENEEKNANK
jgi:uncharacterized protein